VAESGMTEEEYLADRMSVPEVEEVIGKMTTGMLTVTEAALAGFDEVNGSYTFNEEEVHIRYEEDKHNGGNHNNKGTCKDCGNQYANHGEKEPWHKLDSTYHSCGCLNPECSYTYKEKHEDNNKDDKCDKCSYQLVCKTHSGGTHENDGKCALCNTKYQTHVLQSWKYDGSTHWKQCSNSDVCKDRKFQQGNHKFVNGKYYDTIHMDILAEEFKNSFIKNKNL